MRQCRGCVGSYFSFLTELSNAIQLQMGSKQVRGTGTSGPPSHAVEPASRPTCTPSCAPSPPWQAAFHSAAVAPGRLCTPAGTAAAKAARRSPCHRLTPSCSRTSMRACVSRMACDARASRPHNKYTLSRGMAFPLRSPSHKLLTRILPTHLLLEGFLQIIHGVRKPFLLCRDTSQQLGAAIHHPLMLGAAIIVRN